MADINSRYVHHNSLTVEEQRSTFKTKKAKVPFSESSPSGKAGSQCTGHGYTKVG